MAVVHTAPAQSCWAFMALLSMSMVTPPHVSECAPENWCMRLPRYIESGAHGSP